MSDWIVELCRSFAKRCRQEAEMQERQMRRDSDFWDIGSIGAPMTDEEMEAAQAPLVALMEDEPVHTDSRPFCDDPACGCHSDPELLREYAFEPQTAGLLTLDEAVRLIAGKQL